MKKNGPAAALALGLVLAACGGGTDGEDDPTGSAADCFNPALYAAGNRFVFDYQARGLFSGTLSRVGTVVGAADFEGTSGTTELRIDTTQSASIPGMPPVTETRVTHNYLSVDGTALVEYGYVEQITSTPGAETARRVYAPPRRDARAALAVGQSLTISTTATTTYTAGDGSTRQDVDTDPEVVTYLGQESVTVPAGTFTACRFEYRPSGAGGPVHHEWYAQGNGVQLKTLIDVGTSSETTIELLGSSRLNGQPL